MSTTSSFINQVPNHFTQENIRDIQLLMELLSRRPDYKIDGNWAIRIASSLIPLSTNKHDAISMLKEWYWEPSFGVYKNLDFQCQICGHHETIYSFPLKNLTNGNGARCGSRCVTYFLGLSNELVKTDYDLQNSYSSMTKMINDLKEEERRIKIVDTLKLVLNESSYKTDMIAIHSKDSKFKGKLTPKQAAPISKYFDEGTLKITMGTKKHKADAIEVLELIRNQLTPNQLKAANKLI